ncbi:collagenase [Bacillaceae bacterium IKA-2]|nr:collagenase [Bacillaceae bacterium IKA-2]
MKIFRTLIIVLMVLIAAIAMGTIYKHLPSNTVSDYSFTDRYPVIENNHINFFYHPDTKEEVIEMIDKLSILHDLETEIFGETLPKVEPLEVIIVLQNTDDYNQAIKNYDSNVGGLYYRSDKRIVIFKEDVSNLSFAIETFAHEYGHYLFDLFLTKENISIDEVPQWFEEGICEYIRLQTVNTISFPGNTEDPPPFSKLHTPGDWRKYSFDFDVYYIARSAINYLVQQHGGKDVLSKILLNISEASTFENSFEESIGITLNELHRLLFQKKDELRNARLAQQNGDYDIAESIFLDIIAQYPDDEIALRGLAFMYEDLSRWEDALTIRLQLIERFPEFSNEFLYLSFLLTLFDRNEALEMSKQALELTKLDSIYDTKIVETWIDDLTKYNELIKINKYSDAYQHLLGNEQLSMNKSIVVALAEQMENEQLEIE